MIVFIFVGLWIRGIAIETSKNEEHATIDEMEDSTVFKRYAFDTLITYSDLFYIAFYNQDITNLHVELVSYFWMDEFRRLVCETLIPFLYKSSDKSGKKIGKKTD